jgi:tetratricopeptide (TPR) repeat protein
VLELNPEDWGTHSTLALIYLMQGDTQKAWDELDLEVDPFYQEWTRILALPALGREAEAQRRLDAFIQEHQSWAPVLIASVYAWWGEADEAFAWLERAFHERDLLLTGLLQDTNLNSLHDDPRWDEMLKRIGLPHGQ